MNGGMDALIPTQQQVDALDMCTTERDVLGCTSPTTKRFFTFPVTVTFPFTSSCVSSRVNLLLALVHFHICFLAQV